MALSDAEWERSGLGLHWSNRMRIRRGLVKGIRQSQKLEGGVRERQKVMGLYHKAGEYLTKVCVGGVKR